MESVVSERFVVRWYEFSDEDVGSWMQLRARGFIEMGEVGGGWNTTLGIMLSCLMRVRRVGCNCGCTGAKRGN